MKILGMKVFIVKSILLTTIGILFLFTGGCVMTTVGGGGGTVIGGVGVRGEGEIITQAIDVSDFNALQVGGVLNTIYRHSQEFSVSITMHENLFELLEYSVEDGILSVGINRLIQVGSDHMPRLYVNAPYINALHLSGVTNAVDWDTVYADNFHMTVSGASDVSLTMEVEHLKLNVSGASNISLDGNVNHAELMISGASDVNLHVSETLDVQVNGVGNVRYTGDPVVTSSIAGLGSVVKRR